MRERPQSKRWGRWRLLLLLLAGAPLSPRAAVGFWSGPPSLAVGHGWAVVRETREVRFLGGEQELLLEDIPAAADLSSLVLRARRVDVELLEWQRVPQPVAPPQPELARGDDGRDVLWRPGGDAVVPEGGAPRSGRVRCRIRCRAPGQRSVQLVYQIQGWDWEAHYEVAIRGDLEEETQVLSSSLEGRVRVLNPTERVFKDARVVLVGAESTPGQDVGRSRAGILMLDEANPLFELVEPLEPEEGPSYTYPLQVTADLAAQTETDLPLVEARRVPADRLYVMTSETFPLGIGPVRPLRRYMEVDNSPRHGLGRALPPGDVRVFIGGQRAAVLHEGHLPRTPPRARLRIDLGRAPDVLGMRRSLGRARTPAGPFEEAVEIVLQNRRASDVLVEIDEKPPRQLKWTVVSSDEPHEEVRRRLLFRPTVAAGAEKRIYYRLLVDQPVL